MRQTFSLPLITNNYWALKQKQTEIIKGIITSGVWRRKERGDHAIGLGEYESEDLLIKTISKLLRENHGLKLYIYFHPHEKETEEIYNAAIEFYKQEFKDDDIQFCPRDKSSLEVFHKSNVAISVYSSANIERLFVGMKTFYFPAKFDSDFFGNTSLEKILLKSPADLNHRILNAMEMSNEEFMQKNGLEDYYHFGIPQ